MAFSNPPATKYLKSLSTPNLLRTPQRVVGNKVRKITLKHKNKEIGRIEEENVELKKEVSQLKDQNFEKDMGIRELEAETEELRKKKIEAEQKLDTCDDYLKLVFPKMSMAGKADFRYTFAAVAPDMDRGINARLRKNTGINFSIPTANTDGEESELRKVILSLLKKILLKFQTKKRQQRG